MIPIAGFLHLCRLGVREQSVIPEKLCCAAMCALGCDFKNSIATTGGHNYRMVPQNSRSNCQFAWQAE